MPRFAGDVAIVTGASRGIGRAIAQALVSDNARVVVTARNADALETATKELGGPDHAIGVAGKADDVEHQAEAVRAALEHFGRVDMLVNNAGVNPAYGPLMELDLAAARKIFEVNCVAALSWTQQVHGSWMGEHGGSILNVSSVAGLRPETGLGMYGASKAMLGHFTQQLAVELGPRIRVNAVAPGVVKTEFATALYEGKEQRVADTYPLKRLGVPDDVGGISAFLLSQEASWMTGQVVAVEGGVTLRGPETR